MIGLLLFLPGGVVVGLLLNPLRSPTKETTYKLPRYSVSLALLSDLHDVDSAPVINSLRSRHPDLICITGDVLYDGKLEGDSSPLETQANVLLFLRSCASIAPTFMSLGNHEWMVDQEDLQLLSSTGGTVLDNEWRSITGGGKEIVIGGLTSGYVTDYRAFRSESGSTARYPRQESISGIGGAVTASHHKPETDWLSDFAAQPGCKVHLSHHPEYFPLIRQSCTLSWPLLVVPADVKWPQTSGLCCP